MQTSCSNPKITSSFLFNINLCEEIILDFFITTIYSIIMCVILVFIKNSLDRLNIALAFTSFMQNGVVCFV